MSPFIKYLVYLPLVNAGSTPTFHLTEEDIALKEGEDMSAAVDRVLERLVSDHGNHKAKISFKQANQPNNYNQKEDDSYFVKNENMIVHRELINDKYRTEQFRKAINTVGVEGKVVVDFGCGSGILSIFAAKAGASKVYCVEKSKIRHKAEKVIRDNGFSDVIEVVSSIEGVPEDSADVMVSDWMGYMLLTSDMLDPFMLARDRVLKGDGTLIPSMAQMYVQPVSDAVWWKRNVDWVKKNEYGIDFRALMEDTYNPTPVRIPHWGTFKTQKFLGKKKTACQISLDADIYDKDWSCGRANKRDLRWDGIPDNWHGFLITWEVQLYADVWISATTAPQSSFSHWGHVFWPRPYLMKREENSTLAVTDGKTDGARVIGDVPDTTIEIFQIGNGIVKEKLQVSAQLKRNGGYWHDIFISYQYGDKPPQDMDAYKVTYESLAQYDQTEIARVYEGLIASKQQDKKQEKKKKKEEL